MKRVACYCRVSTDEQAKFGFSIQAQKDALTKYCQEHKYKYEFFIDEGISASSMKKRKALNDMLSKSNALDMILFTKLDRLSRNVLDANNINKILKENNCTMKAIDEDDVDTSTADGTFIFNLKVSLAQREIGKTSERIKFVFNNKREKGEVTSGVKKYGYDIKNKKYVVNEEEAENIRNLYEYFIDVNGNVQKTYSWFVMHFKNKGYDAMSNYLRDTSFIGKYKLYRKDVYIDNYIPRIMSDELFNSVQNLIVRRQKNTKKSNSVIALFPGLLYCPRCGNRLVKKQDYRVKKNLIRYVCDNVHRYKVGSKIRKCNNTILIREEHVEEYLLNNLRQEFEKYKIQTTVAKKIVPEDHSSQIKLIKTKLNKLKDLYLDDLIDKETYAKDYGKYNDELIKLQTANENIKKEKDLSSIEKIVNSDFITIYNKLNLNNKRKFWLSIIDKIYVEDGEIKEVTFL